MGLATENPPALHGQRHACVYESAPRGVTAVNGVTPGRPSLQNANPGKRGAQRRLPLLRLGWNGDRQQLY